MKTFVFLMLYKTATKSYISIQARLHFYKDGESVIVALMFRRVGNAVARRNVP